MNTLADTPVPGLVPDISVQPVAAFAAVADIAANAAVKVDESTFQKVKDTLVLIYAFGILGFGLFFPFLLVAWVAFTGPAGQ